MSPDNIRASRFSSFRILSSCSGESPNLDVEYSVDAASLECWNRLDDVDRQASALDFLRPPRSPSRAQGMCNAITRAIEPELLKCLGNYGIRFHAYNPLAGGAFSKSFGASGGVVAGSRFDSSHVQGKLYPDRYWNDAYFDALAEIQPDRCCCATERTTSATRAQGPGR